MLIGIGFAVSADTLAAAETPASLTPLALKGIYEFRLGSVQLGKMGIEIEQAPDHYAVVSDIVTTGLVNTFVRHSSHTTVDGSGQDFHYTGREYESHYQTRKKKKYVKMVFKDGQLAETKLVPADNPASRPPVPDALKKDALDPLSFILALRRHLFEARQQHKDNYSLDVYDGRRLTHVNARIMSSPKEIIYNNKRVRIVPVDITRELKAGFTQNELSDHNPQEPPLHVYFSNDTRLIPLKLEFPFWMGALSATLAKECRTGESCLFGLRE